MFPFRRSPAQRYGPAILDRLPVGISIFRLDNRKDPASLRMVYSNGAADRLTGISMTGEAGRRLVDVLPKLVGTPLLETYATVARTGVLADCGLVVYGDDRVAQRTYHVEAVPLPDRSVGIVFEDVTERAENQTLRDSQAALARQEARYRTLVEATGAVVWTATAEGVFAGDQPGWRDFTGQTEADIADLGWVQALHPDDRQRTLDVWNEATQTRTPYVTTYRVRRPDGTYTEMSAHATPVLGDDGEPTEWVGVLTDIEAQSAAALTLAASEARFRTILDAIGDPILLYPMTSEGLGRFLFFNQAALDVYGYDAETFRTMSVNELRGPGGVTIPEALDELRRTRQGTFESVHRTADGRTIPVQTAARLIEYEGQLCVLAVSRNDTERRAFQRELSRANLELERTVAARTAELQSFAESLKILHTITTGDHETVEARTDAYLRAGCTMFGMPVGILSATPLDEKTGERLYRIEAVVSPDPSLSPGLTVPITEAFCDAVLESGKTVTYADAADVDALSCHPAYASRKLRSFIGTPIRIDDEIIGTLNFVSPDPRTEPFKTFERDLIEIMADAIGRRLVADRASAERRRAQEWSRSIVETVSDGIILVDTDCQVVFSNPSARQLLGLDVRRGSGETDSLPERWPVVNENGEPISPDDLPEREVLRTRRPVRGVVQGIQPPGQPIRWYRVNASPVDYDIDGAVDAVVVTYADVTELRTTTDEARTSAALLTSVQAASPEGVMAFRALRDDSGAISDFEWVLANPRSAKIVDREGVDLVGKRLLDEFPGNVESGLFDAYSRVVETGELYHGQLLYNHDGLQAVLRITGAPLDLGGDGSPDGFVIVFTDVTPEGETPVEA